MSGNEDLQRPRLLPLHLLQSHPNNPRLVQREDVIEAITASLMSGEFDPAHALIVRPAGDEYQILSGHHRVTAARRANLIEVPAWVREMDDAAAYMALATSNAQSELSPLERGIHALRGNIGPSEYARQMGYDQAQASRERSAAEVMTSVIDDAIGAFDGSPEQHFEYINKVEDEGGKRWRALAEIHAAPEWLWPALVRAMLSKLWTVEDARGVVARLQDVPAECSQYFSDTLVAAVVGGTIPARDLGRIDAYYQQAIERIDAIAAEEAKLDGYEKVNDIVGYERLWNRLSEHNPAFDSYADAVAYFDEAVEFWQSLLRAQRETHRERLRVVEQTRERSIRLRDVVSLDEWKELDTDTKAHLLPPDPQLITVGSFNKQDSGAIEWAMWSWNPITGCLHDCPYCYAREIAQSDRLKAHYPNGFEPTLRPKSLLVPRSMRVPHEAGSDTRYRNVFTGSMADIFGRWVPAEWIDAVLEAIRAAPDWNFLCLTKFPKRMAEFDIPPNAWMGTTVDLQARVPAAEAGFDGIGARIKWLSVEPMLEPLRFKHLERFDWVVIGGASRTKNTPEWRPPYAWVRDLERQADDAGCRVYMKTNLFGRDTKDGYQGNARRLELPFDAKLAADQHVAPDVFHYLAKATTDDQRAA